MNNKIIKNKLERIYKLYLELCENREKGYTELCNVIIFEIKSILFQIEELTLWKDEK